MPRRNTESAPHTTGIERKIVQNRKELPSISDKVDEMFELPPVTRETDDAISIGLQGLDFGRLHPEAEQDPNDRHYLPEPTKIISKSAQFYQQPEPGHPPAVDLDELKRVAAIRNKRHNQKALVSQKNEVTDPRPKNFSKAEFQNYPDIKKTVAPTPEKEIPPLPDTPPRTHEQDLITNAKHTIKTIQAEFAKGYLSPGQREVYQHVIDQEEKKIYELTTAENAKQKTKPGSKHLPDLLPSTNINTRSAKDKAWFNNDQTETYPIQEKEEPAPAGLLSRLTKWLKS